MPIDFVGRPLGRLVGLKADLPSVSTQEIATVASLLRNDKVAHSGGIPIHRFLEIDVRQLSGSHRMR